MNPEHRARLDAMPLADLYRASNRLDAEIDAARTCGAAQTQSAKEACLREVEAAITRRYARP